MTKGEVFLDLSELSASADLGDAEAVVIDGERQDVGGGEKVQRGANCALNGTPYATLPTASVMAFSLRRPSGESTRR